MRHLTALALLGIACGTEPADSNPTADEALPPPLAFSLALDGALVEGAPIALVVSGVATGERVYLVGSTATGAGACPSRLAPTCMEIAEPMVMLGEGRGDASGEVHYALTVPGNAGGVSIHLQAASFASRSTSNVVSGTIGHAPVLPGVPFDYEGIELPDHFFAAGPGPGGVAAADLDNTPIDNPITNAGATLGRVLFYDTALSANGAVSCSSCHRQELGFTDDVVLSQGFEGGSTRRHSMGLTNARFYGTGRFFWDERAATLEDQVLMPIQDSVEMGQTLDGLEAAVASRPYYAPLFADAFGDESVSSDRIAKALAQFVRTMVSTESRYDQGRALVGNPGQPFPNFTPQENQGKGLFFAPGAGLPACAVCHATESFSGQAPGPGLTDASNNGLDLASTDDLGVFESSADPRDTGAFKTPSLRNIAVGAPYMHDGRFATLEEVVDHYSTGIQDHPNLHPVLRGPGGTPIRYDFDATERAALVAFLNTLTDETLLTAEMYASPF